MINNENNMINNENNMVNNENHNDISRMTYI